MLKLLWPEDDGPTSQGFAVKASLVGSLLAMYVSKWVNLQVPFLLQRAVDGAAAAVAAGTSDLAAVLFKQVRPMLLVYGCARLATVIAQEIKVCLFSFTSQTVIRQFASSIFSHLHSLDSEFHLRSPSGTISVAYVRAVRGFQTLLLQLVFYVFPALLELVMVAQVLFVKFGTNFAAVTLATFAVYLSFTIAVTEWRVAVSLEHAIRVIDSRFFLNVFS